MKKANEDWAEKYRPKHVKQLILDDDIKSMLLEFAHTRNFPNLLAIGPPGNGKTSAVRALINDIGIPVLEINASLDSGISIIRDEISEWVNTYDLNLSPYKAVIMDQVDRLTKDAQQASLQLMEEVSGSCKFLATSNDARNLHEAFESRLHTINFPPLSVENTIRIMKRICKKEHLTTEPTVLPLIAKHAKGDGRKAIKTLQALGEGKKSITEDNVKPWIWVPPYAKIIKSVDLAINGKLDESVKVANDILYLTQPKWFFLGLKEQLLTKKKIDEDFKTICWMNYPEGNPNAFEDTAVFSFLAKVAWDSK